MSAPPLVEGEPFEGSGTSVPDPSSVWHYPFFRPEDISYEEPGDRAQITDSSQWREERFKDGAWEPVPEEAPPDALRPLPDDARMDAYYYEFDRTGVGAVDAILSAVAWAGKGAHNTEAWQDDDLDWYYSGHPGLPETAVSAVDLIQKTAEQSAAAISTLLEGGAGR